MANVHGNCSTKQWHMQQEDQGQWIEPKRVRERQRRRFQVATNCASFFAPHENEACSNAAARTHPGHSWRGTSNITSHWTSDLVVSNVQHSTFNIITWAEHVLNMSHRAITSSKLKKLQNPIYFSCNRQWQWWKIDSLSKLASSQTMARTSRWLTTQLQLQQPVDSCVAVAVAVAVVVCLRAWRVSGATN